MSRYLTCIFVMLFCLTSPCFAQGSQPTSAPVVAAASQPACVNVDKASGKDLVALAGIGEAKAKAIINFRKKSRAAATKAGKKVWNFKNWKTLMKVDGVGPGVCEKNVTRVCFGEKDKIQKKCPKVKK